MPVELSHCESAPCQELRLPVAPTGPAILWQAHLNAFVWGLGNGLVSTTLASYLARQLGAEGLVFGLIFASQNIGGGLRLFTPWILQWVGSRKWFAVAAFTLSCLLLIALPAICVPGHEADRSFKLQAFVALWGGWHLAMFVGMIALWSWMSDLVQSKIRGRFIGIRQSWLMAGQIAGIMLAAAFSAWLLSWDPNNKWQSYAWPAVAGGWCMLVAVLPLVWMPDVKLVTPQRDHARQLWGAVIDPRFRPLLGFWCYAGLVNGVSQAVQGLFPIVVLKLPLSTTLSMLAAMHLGQILVSPALGYLADRGHSRNIMIGSQVLVSIALFLFPLTNSAATPGQHSFAVGMWLAYGLWIAYAGLNVCLPHLMLKLSPGENSPPYISTYFALSGLAVACSSVLCGYWFDQIPRNFQLDVGALSLDRFELFLYLGGLLRLSSVVWLCWLPREAPADAKIEVVKTAPQLATR